METSLQRTVQVIIQIGLLYIMLVLVILREN
jgi:hypothetical protein